MRILVFSLPGTVINLQCNSYWVFDYFQIMFWATPDSVFGWYKLRFENFPIVFWKFSDHVLERFKFCSCTIWDLEFTRDETKSTADLRVKKHGNLCLASTIPANKPNGRFGGIWPEWLARPLLGTQCRAKWPPLQMKKTQKNDLDFFIHFGRSICQFLDTQFANFRESKPGIFCMPNRG